MTWRKAVKAFFGLKLSDRQAIVRQLGVPLDQSPEITELQRFIGSVIDIREWGLQQKFIKAVEERL